MDLTYQWENLLGHDVLYSGPLFTHLFSHAWIDFRGIRDDFMREKGSDYFENTRRAIAVQREYGARNPRGFAGYGRNFWGITAGDGPDDEELRQNGRDRRFFGYMARGVPTGPTTARSLPGRCSPSCRSPRGGAGGNAAPAAGLPAGLREDRFVERLQPERAMPGGWLSEGWYGLDQGLLVLMIENHAPD